MLYKSLTCFLFSFVLPDCWKINKVESIFKSPPFCLSVRPSFKLDRYLFGQFSGLFGRNEYSRRTFSFQILGGDNEHSKTQRQLWEPIPKKSKNRQRTAHTDTTYTGNKIGYRPPHVLVADARQTSSGYFCSSALHVHQEPHQSRHGHRTVKKGQLH